MEKRKRKLKEVKVKGERSKSGCKNESKRDK